MKKQMKVQSKKQVNKTTNKKTEKNNTSKILKQRIIAIGAASVAFIVLVVMLMVILFDDKSNNHDNKPTQMNAQNIQSTTDLEITKDSTKETTSLETTVAETTILETTTLEIATSDTTIQETTVENATTNTTTENISHNENETKVDDRVFSEDEISSDGSGIKTIGPVSGIATMAFVGDINLSEKLEGYYNQEGLNGFLTKNLQKIMLKADIFGINHEYVSSDAGDEHKVDYEIWYYKNPTYRQKILVAMGVDVVTLANNHTMDYGPEGLLDTMNSLKKVGIAYTGVGNNLKEANTAYIKEVNGKKIAVLAANRVVPRVDWYAYENKIGQMTTYESTDRYLMIREEITRLKLEEGCDIVVVMVHFGENKTPQVQYYQTLIGHGYVDAGADLIIGCHTHTLQGAEIYKGKYIFYGVSNFLFENYTIESCIVQASVQKNNKLEVKLVPCISSQYKTSDVTGAEARRIFTMIENLSTNVRFLDDGTVTTR